MDGFSSFYVHVVMVAVLYAVSSANAEQRATFCLMKSKRINPPINCPKSCGPDILILAAKSQIVTDCTASSSTHPWKLNDTASHLVWNNCNLRGSKCLPVTYHDHSAVRLDVTYDCVNLPSLYRVDMCSDVGYVLPTLFYLHTPKYPNFFVPTSNTNCTCTLQTTGGVVTVTLLDMLTSMPETMRFEWNGGDEDVATVFDDIGFVASMRSVTGQGPMVMKFKPRYPKYSMYTWTRVTAKSTASILLTCNGKLGTTPTVSLKRPAPLCPTTTKKPTTTTLRTTTTPTTTTTPSTTTTKPTTTTTKPTTTTTQSTTTTKPTTTTTPSTTRIPTTTKTTPPTTTTAYYIPATLSTTKPSTTAQPTREPTTPETTAETFPPLIPTSSASAPSSSAKDGDNDGGTTSGVPGVSSPTTKSAFSVYYLVPVVVIIITIIIFVVVCIRRRRRANFEPQTTTSPSQLTRVEMDENFYLKTDRPKYVIERSAENPYGTLRLSSKELRYFDTTPPRSVISVNHIKVQRK